MIRLIPNVEPLREFNRCHEPGSGRFAHATAGRCAPAVVQSRSETARLTWDERRRGEDGEGVQTARLRIALRKGQAGAVPNFMKADVQKALKQERAITAWGEGTQWGSPSTLPPARLIQLNPLSMLAMGEQFSGKHEILSAYRHEVGHLNPTRLGRTAVVGGLSRRAIWDAAQRSWIAAERNQHLHWGTKHGETLLSNAEAIRTGNPMVIKAFDRLIDNVHEEVRAWRNAIRDNRGRVDFGTVHEALATYTRTLVGAYNTEPVPEARRMAAVLTSRLRRYAQRVRRHAKTLKESNDCHDPDDGRFCSGTGAGEAFTGTAYHSTPYEFEEFDFSDAIGPHFGTLTAALDRGDKTGANVRDVQVEPIPADMGRQGWEVWVDGELHSEHTKKSEAAKIAKSLARRTPIEVQLSISNALRLPDLGVWGFGHLLHQLQTAGAMSTAEADTVWAAWQKRDADGWEAMRSHLEGKGYDGIVYTNDVEDAGSDSYIPFRQRQIVRRKR